MSCWLSFWRPQTNNIHAAMLHFKPTSFLLFKNALHQFTKENSSYLCNGAYLLYDRCLHATRLHLLLQEDLLLGRLDDVLSPIGSTDHLQDLTWDPTKKKRCEKVHASLATATGELGAVNVGPTPSGRLVNTLWTFTQLQNNWHHVKEVVSVAAFC